MNLEIADDISRYSSLINDIVITEDIMLSDCLDRKVRGEELPVPMNDTMKEIDSHDIYGGGKKPWELFSQLVENQHSNAVYFFTTAAEIDGDFVWTQIRNNMSEDIVEDPFRGNDIVGYKKKFFYEDNVLGDDDYDPNYVWFMTEYYTLLSLEVPSLDYVLCKLERVSSRDAEYHWVEEEEEEMEVEEMETETEEEVEEAVTNVVQRAAPAA